MAITINTTPSGSPSVQDELWHVCSSDNSGTVDMRYVFDVWINGVQKVRVKQAPEPATGKAYFDAGPTVRNSMTYAWFEPINTTAYVAEPDMSGQVGIVYALRIGEDVSGVTTSNMASGEVSGFNWCPNLFKHRVTALSDKLNKWLTNRPVTGSTKAGENLFIPFYTNSAPGSVILKCRTYDEGGGLIATVSGSPVVVENGFIQMNIGTTALTATLGASFGSNVRYYEVDFTHVAAYETFRVYLTCGKYTPVLVHFLNRWGMYDTQRFDLVSRLSMDVERKGFEKRGYVFNGNSVDYKSSSGRYYEGKINHANKANWMYRLTADAMTDAEWEWMADLIQSSQILMEIDSYFYPVTIRNTNHEYSKYENNKLRPLEIDFEMNQTRYTQLR